jgi:hypothetical protein
VGEVIKAKGNYLWWIVIVLIALAAIGYYFKSSKKR